MKAQMSMPMLVHLGQIECLQQEAADEVERLRALAGMKWEEARAIRLEALDNPDNAADLERVAVAAQQLGETYWAAARVMSQL